MVLLRNCFRQLPPLVLLCFSLPLAAQCPLVNSVQMVENQYRISLNFTAISGPCEHSNPPSEMVVGQEKAPQWVYFWNLGDGRFSRDSRPEQAFSVGTHIVQSTIKPIYSDDDDPLGRMADTIVVDTPTTVSPAYPDRIDQDSSIALNVNWAASRPGGRLIFALSYKQLNSDNPTPRAVYLMFPKDEFEFVRMQSGPDYDGESDIEYDGKPHSVYAWLFDQIDDSSPNGEDAVFVELKVRESVADLLPDTFSSVYQTSVKALYKLDPSQSNGKVDLFGVSNIDTKTSGFGGDSGVSTSSFVNGIDELTNLPISLNWASDPNAMSVYPEVIEPGSSEVELQYRIDFFNGGNDTADKLRVDATIDNTQLDVNTLLTGSTFPDTFNQSFILENTISRWANDTVGLLSLGQAQEVGFPDEHAFGHINFKMTTKPGLVFQEGDTIRARAKIQMDLSEVTTNEAIVRVQSLRIPAPCMYGFKAYFNLPANSNSFHRNGFNLALTARKALGKIPNPQNRYFFEGRIPKSVFPMFWWQAELGYGQTKLQNPEVDSLRLGHLDLTPILLRFIAKKPDLPFGSSVVKRGWGLSAGYTSSFLLHGKANGNKLNLSDWSFGERLDHSFSVSLDLLNLLGRPGLSFGFGWRWRNSAVTSQFGYPTQAGNTGQRAWYNHPFVYAHYTFSHRLRYELGGFN